LFAAIVLGVGPDCLPTSITTRFASVDLGSPSFDQGDFVAWHHVTGRVSSAGCAGFERAAAVRHRHVRTHHHPVCGS
jgi:hypothetical protein